MDNRVKRQETRVMIKNNQERRSKAATLSKRKLSEGSKEDDPFYQYNFNE